MIHSSRRPLTTYARRRARPRDTGSTTQSSPIRPLSTDQDEDDNHVPFAMMARRMNKRARLVSRSTDPEAELFEKTAQSDGEDRPSKRQRGTPAYDDNGPWTGGYMRDLPSSKGSEICTPPLVMPSDQSMAILSRPPSSPAPDQLSPLPVARRILSRTSSRNFKENAGARNLASPFNSRPGSRAASPDKVTKPLKKRAHHVKSRTLSRTGVLREKTTDRNVVEMSLRIPTSSSSVPANDSIMDAKTVASNHSRSSSTPSLQPTLAAMSSETWLIPPEAASRFPPPVDSVLGFDSQDMDADLPSFYVDAPLHCSTPPRRRRSATVGVWNQGLMPQLDADPPPPVRSLTYDSDVDMSDSSRPGSPSDSRVSRANPPRRRRRTIVHLPSDSLFSSSLDFSSMMSETKRFPRAPASEGSRSPQQQPPITALALEPAFSLGSSPHDAQRSTRTDLAVPVATSSVHRTLPDAIGTGLPSVEAGPGGAGDELLDLFSVLGLDEDEKWDDFKDVNDSGVAWSMSRSQSHDSNLSSGSLKNSQARRKRGDTIRASDYAKLPLSGLSGSFDSASTAGGSGTKRGDTRRTRSGTVTQASNPSTSKRKHEGWPTIKMRTNPEPLRADGNEDDELLLKDGDVIE